MKKLILSFCALIVSFSLWAYDFEVEGIYYNITDATHKTVEVTYNYYDYYSGSLIIPSSVTYNGTTYSVTGIEEFALGECDELTEITIPNSFAEIGDYDFYGCSGLLSVTIPNSVTSIGIYAFYGCINLVEVTIPNSVTSIGLGAFYGCSGLTSVTIGNSVITIGNDAFENCTGLNSVHITDLAQWCKVEFGDYAANPLCFAHNLYLNGTVIIDLIIPNNVTSIGGYAFYGCTGLTSVTIPNGVTEIGNEAFSGCTGLTSVTIPNSVTEIGNWAFSGCSGLIAIYCYATTPPSAILTIFDYPLIYQNAILYVPAGCESAYRAAVPWTYFGNIQEIKSPNNVEDNLAESITITTQNGVIEVNGINDPVIIEVYSTNGQQLYSGSDTTIPVNERGTYLVRVGNCVEKVVL